MRLDQYLHAHGLTPSRERARALIMAGHVYLEGQKALKAGQPVPEGAEVEVRGGELPYVSRGGLKLEKAIKAFTINAAGLTCMDVGASTGGFTDCLLQNGAARVYAVDVGYGQLAWKLRCDERVVVLERTNIRHLTPETVPDKIALFTVDVAFISLKHVFPAMSFLCTDDALGVCLVKPQFEAGRDKVGKKGVIKDAAVHLSTIIKCAEYANNTGYSALDIDYSPIKGPEGNIEFLLLVRRSAAPAPLDTEKARKACERAHLNL